MLSGKGSPVQRLEQKAHAQTLAMRRLGNGKPRQEDDRHGMSRQTPDEPTGGGSLLDASHGEAVVADDLAIIGDEDKCPGGVLSLRSPRVVGEPAVQGFVATAERGAVVVFVQPLDAQLRDPSEAPRSLRELDQSRVPLWRSIERLEKATVGLLREADRTMSLHDLASADDCVVKNETREGDARQGRRLDDELLVLGAEAELPPAIFRFHGYLLYVQLYGQQHRDASR